MSSDMKDARWGLAGNLAHTFLGLEYEDFSYSGWQKVLDEAQRLLEKYPEDIERWANEFRSGDE